MIGLLLTLSFVVSLIALAFLIWAVATRQMAFDQRSASTIFVEGEEGHPDDAGVAPESDERVPHHLDTARAGLHSVSDWPVHVVLLGPGGWLEHGTPFGLHASLHTHWTGFSMSARPLHLR